MKRNSEVKADMKFLVVAKLREIPPVPPEQSAALSVAEWQTVQQFLKEGKTEVAYALAGLKGGMGISEAESGAEINRRLSRLPLFPFLDIEIYPLMTVDEALTQAKEWLEAIKAKR